MTAVLAAIAVVSLVQLMLFGIGMPSVLSYLVSVIAGALILFRWEWRHRDH